MIAIVETGNAIQFLVNRVLFACLIGRVVVDFFAENLGAPAASAYPNALVTTNEGELVLLIYYILLFISSSSIGVFDCRHILFFSWYNSTPSLV